MITSRDQEYYDAIVVRDANYDGRFYYGVRTTGVFCRPGCSSRRPLAQNVEFFATAQAAARASYRPCRRCKPERPARLDERLERVCRAIEQSEEPPRLQQLAAVAGISPWHLQRRFKAAIGVSPRQYGAMVKRDRLRGALRQSRSVTDAVFEAGFGSLSQAYGDSDAALGMTPSQFRRGGCGAGVAFVIVGSPLGRILIAATPRGICRVDIGESDEELERRLCAEYPNANLAREDGSLDSPAARIVRYLSGRGEWPMLPVDVRASAFQASVWEALRAIKPGGTATYGAIAQAIGSPGSARAVARACAANPVALLIPCHRVLPARGAPGGYRWNPSRKKQLLDLERAR